MKLRSTGRWLPRTIGASIGTLALTLASAVFAEETPPSGQYVTRAEYERVLKELDLIKQKLGVVEQATTTQMAENEDTFTDYDKQLKEIKSLATRAQPGTTSFLLTGWADAGFVDRSGEDSNFTASLNPILLWRLNDRLFFEGEFELELEDNETALDLEYANISYILNDYVTLKAGRFLTPFGTFSERLHPGWINKLPDAPLPFGHDGIAPTASLGFQASGGFAIGSSKLNYALYVANGPRLNMGDDEPEEAGLLHFDNLSDLNNNKAVGGRVGFLPIPELEIGYSFKYARVDEDADVSATLHSVDLGYVRDSNALRGFIDVKGQWVWSRVDDVTFDPDGELGFGPLDFDNRRDGGYAQLAYRPSKVESAFVQNLEGVVRWDRINNPAGAPEETGFDEKRWTFGLNYWLGSSTALKAAYQTGDRRLPDGDSEDVNAVLVQAATGF